MSNQNVWKLLGGANPDGKKNPIALIYPQKQKVKCNFAKPDNYYE